MLFANKIRQLRDQHQLLQRQLASELEIDTPMYSKIERGERRAKREQVITIAKLLGVGKEDLLSLWLADQVYAVVKDEEYPIKVLNIVQENITEYGKGYE